MRCLPNLIVAPRLLLDGLPSELGPCGPCSALTGAHLRVIWRPQGHLFLLQAQLVPPRPKPSGSLAGWAGMSSPALQRSL